MKKILSLLFVLLSATTLWAQTSGTSGTCRWSIDNNGLLTIRPTDGVSGTLENWKIAPWYESREYIKSVKIESGVSVSTCNGMFSGCSNLTSVDLSNLNTQNVTDMCDIFDGCSSLTTLDLTSFDTRKVTNMSWMFCNCSSLTTLDLSHFDTQNVTDMTNMFSVCSSLTTLDLSHFDTRNVTDMNLMFYYCSSLTTLDLSHFDTRSVTNMFGMFSLCSKLNTIYSMVETPSKLNSGIFDSFDERENCNLIVPEGSKAAYAEADGWNELGVIEEAPLGTEEPKDVIAQGTSGTCQWAIDDEGMLTIRPTDGVSGTLGDWGDGEAPWYEYRESIKSVKVENGVSARTCRLMFYECSNLTNVDLVNFDTQNVTDMSGMFYGCSGLTSLDLSHFDTQNVTNMTAMFFGCSGLTSLDLTHFDTQNVTNMGVMFYECSGLTSLDLTHFDTQNVEDMQFVFSWCSGLTSLDLSNFNTQNVTNMGGMFLWCSGLTSLDLTHFDTQNVTDMDLMFAECSGLKRIYSMVEIPSKLQSNTFDSFNERKTCILIVPEGCKAAYAKADGWNELGVIEEAPLETEEPKDVIAQGTSGTCGWIIDNNGLLTIRPTDGVSGTLESWDDGEAPWAGLAEDIVAARIESGVNTSNSRNLFSGCVSLLEVQWEASTIPADAIGTGTPANMIIYAPEGTQTELDYNVVIGGKCEYLKLTEGEPLSISQEFEAEYAILTRTFSKPTLVEQSAGWESIVVPFDVTSIIDEQDRPLAPFGSDKTGTHPFWLAQMSPGGNFTYCTEMKANTPYPISMPNSPLYIDEFNITGEVQFIGENVTVKKTSDAQTVEGTNMQIVPTYTEIAADGTGLYVMNREPIIDEEENEHPAGSVFVSDNTSVALPFEFYVMPKSAPVKGQYIPINIDNAADQLQRLYADTYGSLRIHSENHRLVIQATKPQTIGIYNAQGIHVCTLRLQPGENRTPQLPAGLYVVGKEKYMVK